MEDNQVQRVTIDLPEGLQRALKIACAIRGISMRKLVIEAISEKLEKLESK